MEIKLNIKDIKWLFLIEIGLIELAIFFPVIVIPAFLGLLLFVFMAFSPINNIAIILLLLIFNDVFPGIALGAFSISPIQIVILIAYFHWIVGFFLGEKLDFSIFKTYLFYLIILFLGFCILSVRVATHKIESIRFLRDMFFWMAFGVYTIYHIRSFSDLDKIFNFLIYVAALASLLGLLQFIFKFDYFVLVPGRWKINKITEEFFRVNGTFVDPNFLGNFLIAPLIIIITRIIVNHDYRKIFWGIFIFFILILTNSRGALLAFILGLLLLLFIVFKKHQNFSKIMISSVVVVVFLFSLFLVLPKDLYVRFLPNFKELDWAILVRIMYLYISYNVIIANPVWGVGIHNFQLIFRKYTPKIIWESLTLGETRGVLQGGGYNHNTFLTVWAETGVFNFLIFVLFNFLALRLAFKIWQSQNINLEHRSALLAICIAFIAINIQLLTITYFSYHYFLFLFLLIIVHKFSTMEWKIPSQGLLK